MDSRNNLLTEKSLSSFDPRHLSAKFAEKLMDHDNDDAHKSTIENTRLFVKNFLENTVLGSIYQHIFLILSIVSCFQYIYQTYISESTDFGRAQLYFFLNLELCIAVLFLFDWLLGLFIADHKIAYFTGFFSMVDLMTVIPVFATYNEECPNFNSIDSITDGIYYVLCAMFSTRILRALRFRRLFTTIEDEVRRFLADMGLKIVVMLLFNAALIQYLEHDQSLTFHTWTYFMLVTITTVGYGDISPSTTLGRFAAMGMIIVAIIIVPQMSNELMEKISQQSIYARATYEPKTRKSSHVLVCGDLKSSSLHEFFNELFHEDHDIRNLYAVILQPFSPTYEIKRILKDPQFSLSVTFLEGNALNEKDLQRAKASSARAIFILTNKFSSDPDEEDAKIILQQFSIQRFLKMHSAHGNGRSDTLFCLQLIRPENKRHLVIPDDDTENKDLVVCLNEIKMGVIAKAVIFPGANTLIMNLLTSFADDKVPSLNNRALDGIETLDEDEDSDWIGEYQRGCDWEIYTTELSSTFEGSTFCSLSEILYQKLGIVLFALEIEDLRKDKSGTKLLLNPADFVIPSKQDFRIEAFVLAKNKSQSDLSFSKSQGHEGFGAGFSHLSLLANGLAQRMSIHGGTGISRVTPSGHIGGAFIEDMNAGEQKDFREKQAWQVLLRRYETEKSSETLQEEQQRIEDRKLRENYFIRDTHMDLEDAMIKTSVAEEMTFVDNHIIIIGKSLSNLYDLIRPLRAKHLGELKHIIILYPSDFPPAVWQRISIFESVWILRGSALEEADIRRAGIFKAKQVVVLADASASEEMSGGHQSAAAGMDALVDADAIFCYQCVRRMNEHAHVVVEIVRHTNVGYLDPESGLNSSEIDYKFTPQFASGALFATSLLDTLACQAFYNTKIIDVINKLIGGVEKNLDGKKGNNNRSSKGGESSKNNSSMGMVGSSLYQISIPEGLESRTYGSLYRLLARRKQIPLGILRGIYSHTKSGPKNNKMPYVFTNPAKDTELFTCDKVFVLSQKPIAARHHRGGEEMKEMQMYSNIRSRRKTAEDIIRSISTVQDDLRLFQSAHNQLEAKVNDMAFEINHKFDALFQALKVSYEPPTIRSTNQSPANSRPSSAKRTGSSKDTNGLAPIISGGRPIVPKSRGVSFDSGNYL